MNQIEAINKFYANRVRLYFGYPVSDSMESIDSSQEIINHLIELDNKL